MRLKAAVHALLAVLPRRLRLGWLAITPLAFGVAVMESIGAMLVFGLIRLMSEPEILGRTFWGITPGDYLPQGDALIPVLAIGLAGFYLAKNALALFVLDMRNALTTRSASLCASRLFTLYLSTPYDRVLERNSAELTRNLVDSVETAYRQVLGSCVSAGIEIGVALGLTILLILAGPVQSLAVLAGLILALFMLMRFTQSRFGRWGRRDQRLKGEVLKSAQQGFGVLKEVRVLGRTRYFADRFGQQQHALGALRRHALNWSVAPRYLVETIFVCGMLIVLAVLTGGGRSGPSALAMLGLYAYVGFRVIPAFNRIVEQLSLLRHGVGAVEALRGDLARLAAGEDAALPAQPPTPRGLKDSLQVIDLGYRYPAADSDALTGVSFTLRRGEALGIIGATGAGKSTLLDVLLGLRSPTRGRILADGRDIAADLPGWSASIGYVPQEISLIDDTLRRNIALGLDDAEIDEPRLVEAVRLAQLEDFIAALPEGLDTVVAERGLRLSGGQRQRVAIARALYHRPGLLILDEATSALDSATELAVTQAVRSLHGRVSVIVVAHRLSTVRDCDQLIRLEYGRVVQCGNFADLMAADPALARAAGLGLNP